MRSDVRAVLLVRVIVISAISTSALTAQHATGSPREEGVYPIPSCDSCSWTLGPGHSVLSLLRDTTLWFGALPGTALDRQGRLYVADLTQRQVFRLDLASRNVLRIGREGRGPGEFMMPQLVAVGPDDHCFVYDASSRTVSEFNESGAFVRTFPLSVPLIKAWAMVADAQGQLYVSGTGASGPSGAFVVHQFDRTGAWLRSFGEKSRDFPDETERLNGDAGPLWWDDQTNTLWFSRGGPRLELLQFSTDGSLMRRVRLADGILSTWRPRMRFDQSENGGLRVSASSRLGSISLVPLPGRFLLNITLADDQRRMRYDVFRIVDGAPITRWTEINESGYLGLGDGKKWVYRFDPAAPDQLLRHVVQFMVRKH